MGPQNSGWGGKDRGTRLGIEAELRIQAEVEVMDQVGKAEELGTEHTSAELPLFLVTGMAGEVGWGCTHSRQPLLNLCPTRPEVFLFHPHRGSRPHPGHCARLCGGHCGSGTGAGPGLPALSGNL